MTARNYTKTVRLTKEEEEKLNRKIKEFNCDSISDYIRFALLNSNEDMKIHKCNT